MLVSGGFLKEEVELRSRSLSILLVLRNPELVS